MAVPATAPTASGCTRAARPRSENTRPGLERCSAHRVRPDRPHRPRSRPVFGLPLRQLASDPSVPVEGGSANDYEYAYGDPVNNFDLDGTRCLTGVARRVQEERVNSKPGKVETKTREICRSIVRGGIRAAENFDLGNYSAACFVGAAKGAATGALTGVQGAVGGAALGCGVGIAATFAKDAGIDKQIVKNAELGLDIAGGGRDVARGSIQRVLRDLP